MSVYNFSGGILYAILLESCPIADNRKDCMNGGKATFKSNDILQELMQLSGIRRNLPGSMDASEYKKCTAQGAMRIQNGRYPKEFDANIKGKYDELYKKANAFINKYLFDSKDKHREIAERLFFALYKATNIPDTASFIYLNNRISKKDLLELKTVDLPALILGTLHYCIENIPDNKKGSDMFKYLFENAEKGGIYHFKETIENPYQYSIEVLSGDPNIHDDDDLLALDEIPEDDVEEIKITDTYIDDINTALPAQEKETRIENSSSPANAINFNFTVNGDNANVRNIVNYGTYNEGSEDNGKK